MDSTEIGRVVLMSIHPTFGNAIISGTKRVEFRKRPIGKDVTHVFLYATLPIGAIIGAFEVVGQHTNTLSGLWSTFRECCGINYDHFCEYFRSSTMGTGIQVGTVFTANDPILISEAFGLQRPPQSYQYVCTDRAQRLLSTMNSVSSLDNSCVSRDLP